MRRKIVAGAAALLVAAAVAACSSSTSSSSGTTANGPTGTQTCPQSPGQISGTIHSTDVIGPVPQGIAPGEFAELVAAIRNKAVYVNVHSQQFQGGEIRGQLL